MRGKQATDPRWKFVNEDGSDMPLEHFPVNRVVTTGERLVGHVVGVHRPDRDYVTWVLCNAFPLHSAEGVLTAVTVAFIEVTEKKRAEIERRLADAQLAQADRLSSMGLLAAGVAHEINNPLTYLMNNLELLCADLPAATQGLDARWRDDLIARANEAWEGSRRIRDIATGLSSFTRVDETALQYVDLRQPLDAAAAMASNEIRFRARLTKEYQSAALVRASEGRLSQVFLNLLINAAHAMDGNDTAGPLPCETDEPFGRKKAHREHQICLRVFSEGEESCVEILDNGDGIPPERLERLFDPFFTTKPVGKGSGLGLTISRNIVESYGGRLSISSTVGVGTSVQVRLPASPAPSVIEERPPSVAPASEGGLRILLVDDEPLVRKSLVRLLREHETVALGGGEEAIELLKQDVSFDLVLCDMMMPGTSGMEVHAWLTEHAPALAEKFVFVTGGVFTQAASDYLAQAGVPRLSKPFDAAEFRKQVSGLLDWE